MLTNLHDAFGGRSRSPNIVGLPFRMLVTVSYCVDGNFVFSICFYDIRLPKNVVTLKCGQRSLKVIESGIIR